MRAKKTNFASLVGYCVFFIFVAANPILGVMGLLKPVGFVLVVMALFISFSSKRITLDVPWCLIGYTLWGVWCLLSGLCVSESMLILWVNLRTLLMIVICLWASYAFFSRQEDFSYYYIALLIASYVNVLAVVMDYQVVRDVGGQVAVFQDVVDTGTTRIAGLKGNSNGLAFSFLMGTWACIMLWRDNIFNRLKMIKWIVLSVSVCIFGYYILQTASRKSLLVFTLLVVAWLLWMVPGKISASTLMLRVAIVIAIVIGGSSVISYMMSDTIAGARFQELFDSGGGNAVVGFKEENIRYEMYVEGLKMWLCHPVAGVGLGQFCNHFWSGQYSHSDIIEPLACTGAVGFCLYASVAFSVLKQLVVAYRKKISEAERYKVRGMILFLVCNYYLIGLGCPMWSDPIYFITIIMLGVFVNRLNLHCRGWYVRP